MIETGLIRLHYDCRRANVMKLQSNYKVLLYIKDKYMMHYDCRSAKTMKLLSNYKCATELMFCKRCGISSRVLSERTNVCSSERVCVNF